MQFGPDAEDRWMQCRMAKEERFTVNVELKVIKSLCTLPPVALRFWE